MDLAPSRSIQPEMTGMNFVPSHMMPTMAATCSALREMTSHTLSRNCITPLLLSVALRAPPGLSGGV